MIKTYDDLKAQRALAHNDLQLAKSKLTADTESWKQQAKPLRVVGAVASNLFTNKFVGRGKKGIVGKGLQLGLNAVLAKTALKGLPTPLNILLPQVVENVALNYANKHGRDWLITGLRWVKKVTEESKPQAALVPVEIEVQIPVYVPTQDVQDLTQQQRIGN